MASSYSDLGIELMATGENAGTWGTKTNTNLQIVEKAIAGYVEQAVTSGGTTTLSITDGDATESTSVARHAVIKLTGTITGNSIVTVPDSVEKVYIVTNGTSGAYTVQFKTASGTGITFGVSEKTTRLVYSDGTNLVDAGFGGALDIEGRELVLDADGDTTITADTDDQIDIKVGGTDRARITTGAIAPSSSDGISLGTSALEFSDLFLADGAVVNFGDDQEIKLTHVADTGLTLKHTATGDDKPVSITLQTGETDIAANDIIGKIDFQAPDEGTGTDAILVAAGIEAVSEGDFSSSSNATKLSFKTGASEAASEKMSLSSGGNLTISGDLTVSGDDITMGTNTAGNLLIADGTNFNSIAAGSLSEISTVANDDVFIAVDTSGGGLKKIARSTIVAGLATSAALTDIVSDTSPQLGANLDTNSHNILIDDAHFIADENGNEQIIFQTTSSAVNQFDITNAATSNPPSIQATGGDSNIDFNIGAKGTGHVTILGNDNPGTIQFNCENNSHGQQLKAQAHSVGSSAVHTLPNVTGELMPGKIAGTNFTGSLLVGHATTGTLDAAQYNTGVGLTALDAVTSGDNNTALGYGALTASTSGARNTAIGVNAMAALTSGQQNVAIGHGALDNANNSYNVAVGTDALTDTTGQKNTAIGYRAGYAVAGGEYNITIGSTAGDNITSGSGNVVIGVADVASATGDDQLSISDGEDGSVVWIKGDSSGVVTFADDILIKDGGTIGSASDADAIAIGSDGDVTLTQDLELQHDGAILSFGANDEVTLTHVHDDGLLLNTDMQLQFRDSAINIRSDADGDLDINADDEVEINSTLIDVNGNLDVSGTLAQAGVATFSVAANVAQVALTSSSNAVAWDASAAANAYHITTENTTFSAPSNAVEGAFICLELNFNGSHTIGWNTGFEFAASTEPTETATDAKTDIHVFRYNGAVWQEVGRTLNLSES